MISRRSDLRASPAARRDVPGFEARRVEARRVEARKVEARAAGPSGDDAPMLGDPQSEHERRIRWRRRMGRWRRGRG